MGKRKSKLDQGLLCSKLWLWRMNNAVDAMQRILDTGRSAS
jgi:hypothetical protein